MTTTIATTDATRRHWLPCVMCLIATGSMLGITSSLAKLAGENDLPPLAFLAWSIAGAAIVLTGFAALRDELPPLTARTMEYFAVNGLISVALPNLVVFAAVPKVGAAFVTLALSFPPLFTYLGALLLGMERFHAARAAGVGLALAGAALLAAYKLSDARAVALWIAATLAVPVLLAVGNIYRTLRWPDDAAPAGLAPGMLVVASILLFAAGLIPSFSLAVPTDSAAPILLVGLQIANFSVFYFLFFILQRMAGPVYLSLIGSVAAVVGGAIAILLLGETPPRGLAIGAVLIALGIALITRQTGQSSKEVK